MPGTRPRSGTILWGALAAAILLASVGDRLVRPAGSLVSVPPRHNCRLWGITGPAPPGLIDDHLRSGTHSNFKLLSEHDRDGWGIVSFPTIEGASALVLPLARRGGVYAGNPHDPDFDLSVAELDALRPSAALAHVRSTTAAHDGIPDPHPFVHEGYAFAHNGAVNVTVLLELLTSNDPTYLMTHPPAYTGEYIDSELYFLWLLKYRHLHRELSTLDALQQAVSILYARVSPQRLNFVLTRGDTLWACRCAGNDPLDPLRFHPGQIDPPSPCWVVCSTIVGSDSLSWGSFPPLSVARFVPGEAPYFVPLSTPGGAPEPEGGEAETPGSDRPRSSWLGEPHPNPTDGSVSIPLRAAVPSGPLTVEIWSASGALVWRDERPGMSRGAAPVAIRWPGLDPHGRPVSPGVYFCRARAGSARAERKITVVR